MGRRIGSARRLECLVTLLVLGLSIPAEADIFTVTTTDDSGAGSLRQAILDADGHSGVDRIEFDIPGEGVQKITLMTKLPSISSFAVIIDGLSQPGASCSTWPPTLLIELDGSVLTGTSGGLWLREPGNTIQGLIVRSFPGGGIRISGGATNILCNYIGTDSTGSVNLGNGGSGIAVDGSSANQIGSAAMPNLISGNGGLRGAFSARSLFGSGLVIALPSSSGNYVHGNYIGTDATGLAEIPNKLNGILIRADSNSIGGPNPGEGNLISGNGSGGISIEGDLNVVAGNAIGLDASGDPTLGNGTAGILLTQGASENLIGGDLASFANVIAGNGSAGIQLGVDDGGVGNTFRNNQIFENGGIGIEIGSAGTNTNDAGDPDVGANNLQNHPELSTSTLNLGGELSVAYQVDSSAQNTDYPITVDFNLADIDGEEGAFWLASDTYSEVKFLSGVPVVAALIPFVAVDPGDRIVATATTQTGDTSEFSPAVVVVPEPDALRMQLAGISALAVLAVRGRRILSRSTSPP